MDEHMKKSLARLRRKFGIEPGADTQSGDPAAALESRHGIDPARYGASPWYRRQVDALAPDYARAAGKERAHDKGTPDEKQ
jgi:hypothetical protein